MAASIYTVAIVNIHAFITFIYIISPAYQWLQVLRLSSMIKIAITDSTNNVLVYTLVNSTTKDISSPRCLLWLPRRGQQHV